MAFLKKYYGLLYHILFLTASELHCHICYLFFKLIIIDE